MAKENKQQKQSATKPTPPKQKTKSEAGNGFLKVMANIGGAVIAAIFLTVVFKHNEPDPQNPTEEPINRGYDWLLNTMLKGNLETIEKYPDLNAQQRLEMKWGGGEISYIFQIKNQTPETAVVLLPPKEVLLGVGFKNSHELPWLTYFVYPRKVVYENDTATSSLYAQADYLVSINGWGLDKLSAPIEQPQPFMILKLK